MIHDSLFNLLCSNVDTNAFSAFIKSDVSKQFINADENDILERTLKFCETHRFIEQFILKYGTVKRHDIDDILTKNENELRRGQYLQTIATSLKTILDRYNRHIIELEKSYLKQPDNSLMFVQSAISHFDGLFQFLKRFIIELTAQQFHGCAILQYLQRYNHHGNDDIKEALTTMRRNVHSVFLQQLTQWLINGQLVDMYEEFFIQHRIEIVKDEQRSQYASRAHSVAEKSSSSERTATPSEVSNVNSELWRYEISYDMLPLNLSPSWAEKVLFIGQTVVMLSSDPRNKTKRATIWRDDEPETLIGSLWNNQEHIYSERLQTLYSDKPLDISQYDNIIDEIKNYVTERLSDIAFKQADLIRHLKLVKEFYLLGRGELFLEFIKQTQTIDSQIIDQKVARDVNRAFQTAANRTNNDLDQISMHLPLDDIDVTSLVDDSHIFLQLVQLKFDVKWPLHLFFSPNILKRYNDLFRFLLQIRKFQNDLHMVWAFHREKKMAKGDQLAQMRSKLMFFIDNLQYYLQVDVLEGQFSILMNAVLNSKDFEYIQRAHSVFQANIMSLCFLLNTGTSDSVTVGISLNRTSVPPGTNCDEQDNPVLIILHKIMRCINTFCNLSLSTADPMTAGEAEAMKFNDQMFNNQVSELMKLLSGLKAGPSSAPLAQFLLRLDFNYWFSSQCNQITATSPNV